MTKPTFLDYCVTNYNPIPAYHMNKLHWLTVLPASDVPEELIRDLIRSSYALTDKRRK